ncbi:NDR1/HIN1-like protein 10 [Sesamum alatum]|uniref:NDR1/HIN1-like protein 10 n=1 Tax=Sesamum alatum TaxID=300844 RepID=A0AAE1Z247_9LAMI|nr:NDR1/HIN1-like protein 10 [Sesamum alatum]
MEDHNRPVTGYPAPNPNPNPNPNSNANGYSATQPPPGTAYPYAAAAAAPPPINAYYSHQNNPYYQQNYQPDPNIARRATFLRRVLAFVIGLIIVFATITFIVWLVLRPQLPEFRVDTFSFSNFTLGNNSLISFTSEVRLTARNPNKKMTLSYDHIQAVVFYKSWSLSDTMIPPFSQGTKNETSLTANFAAAGSFLDKPAVDGINSERGNNGNVGFNLRMVSIVSFKAKAWRTRRRFLRVFCGDLAVGVRSNGGSGTLIGGPRQCRVGI